MTPFERELARYLGSPRVMGQTSGTEALHLALRALSIGQGDEVIAPSFGSVATMNAIRLVGATPLFVDIDPVTFTLDPAQLETSISPSTRAIVPSHLFGQPAEMPAILSVAQRHGLSVIEDCTQALGAEYKGQKVGTFGTIGCFAFVPDAGTGLPGAGAAVCTNDPAIAGRIDARLDEAQAELLRIRLSHLDAWNEARREVAARYHRLLSKLPGVIIPEKLAGSTPIYDRYTVRVHHRDAVRQALAAEGIEAGVEVAVPLQAQEAPVGPGRGVGAFPVAGRAAAEVLSLPISAELTEGEQDRVVETLARAVGARSPV